MNRRSSSLSLRLGWATVLALVAAWAATGPASADVVAVTINPTASVAKPGGASMTVSGTVTALSGCNDIDVDIFQDQGQQTVFGHTHIFFCASFQQPDGWIAMVPALGPGFKTGKANVLVTVFNCGNTVCNQVATAATVSVKPQ
jgi:hypothetical protein